ncbi:MAG TPA: glycoside hydrolase family 43 protein, partial [Pyrinomonadaceae bacterium]
GEYWAYSTGFWRDGRAFGVLHSRDLVHWRELDGALAPLDGAHPCYWAPEVVCENGRFLMYYSVGNEKLMHIRVAVAEHPAGPFTDSGHQLTGAEFAIDPHVFVDADDTRWLFYATDFLTHKYIGTGTVRERMLDPFTLAGDARPVTRARYDWQVYDPAREEKGGVRWHTVEGPFVLRRINLYYQLFSGGNWQNLTYGVSYAVSDRVEREDEWEQAADGARVLPILRTIPERVIGPGHNSVVRGPDNQQLFCVYHRWDGERGRVLSIDRLDWVGERMVVLGASTTPQFAPATPTFAGFYGEHENDLGAGWTCAGGSWSVRGGEAQQVSAEGARASARCDARASSFILEVSLRSLDADGAGAFGVALMRDDESALQFLLDPKAGEARLDWQAEDGASERLRFALPADFAPRAFHAVRIVVDNSYATISLDERVVRWQGTLKAAPDSPALVAEDGAKAAFKGFELTIGWEELFTQTGPTLAARGWRHDRAGWRLQDDLLRFDAPEGHDDTGDEAGNGVNYEVGDGSITRGPLLESYELVVNVRLEREHSRGAGVYGFYPAYSGGSATAAAADDSLITVERDGAGGGWALVIRNLKNASQAERRALPESFDPFVMQQFRFRKQGGRLLIHWEATPLGEVNTTTEATAIGLYARRAQVVYDMVRVTALRAATSDE